MYRQRYPHLSTADDASAIGRKFCCLNFCKLVCLTTHLLYSLFAVVVFISRSVGYLLDAFPIEAGYSIFVFYFYWSILWTVCDVRLHSTLFFSEDNYTNRYIESLEGWRLAILYSFGIDLASCVVIIFLNLFPGSSGNNCSTTETCEQICVSVLWLPLYRLLSLLLTYLSLKEARVARIARRRYATRYDL